MFAMKNNTIIMLIPLFWVWQDWHTHLRLDRLQQGLQQGCFEGGVCSTLVSVN